MQPMPELRASPAQESPTVAAGFKPWLPLRIRIDISKADGLTSVSVAEGDELECAGSSSDTSAL
jgi:hypothetical protein